MTDPMNDLRQASADVSGVEVLSPAAQAVLDAAEPCVAPNECPGLEAAIAAALRAAADQVVPGDGSRRANEIRFEFLAIATELENQ